jgi:PAS domain S-box-containing protein
LIEASRRAGNGILYNKSVEGFPILNVFNRVPGTDWTVLVGIPEAVLYAPVKATIGRLVGLIVAVTLLIASLIFFFYRRINIAITHLLNLAEDPLRSDQWGTASNSFTEFDAVAEKLKTVAMQQQHVITALSQSEERYRVLFKSIDEGFCIIEMIYDEHKKPVDWRFLEVNPAFEKQTGLHEATGKRIRELAPDIETNWYEIYGKVALTGEPIRFQNEAKGLGERWFNLYAFRIGGPGSHKVAVIFSDITQAKHQDEELHAKNVDLERARAVAEKASLAKSEFLTGMSHDLRTPLNAILGFAQLVESGSPAPTPSQKRSLDHIIKGGWFLLSLISEILDLAAIESGKLTLSLEPVLLSDVVFECIGMAEHEARKREVHLRVLPLDNAWTVYADQTRLTQVLNNLISNATKYNRRQGTVEVKCAVSGADRIRVSVKDNGIGLPPEKRSQLFQPFNRLGQEAGTEEGTGLGLALSKRLVEEMGGSIGVESSAGAGSEFWFELIRDVTPQAAAPDRAAAIG